MVTQDNNFKLYSRNKTRRLLGISLSTLDCYISTGLIGTIILPGGRVKIPHQELQRFIEENINREKKQSLLLTTGKVDLTNFINGRRALDVKQLNSTELFEKIMEKNNG